MKMYQLNMASSMTRRNGIQALLELRVQVIEGLPVVIVIQDSIYLHEVGLLK